MCLYAQQKPRHDERYSQNSHLLTSGRACLRKGGALLGKQHTIKSTVPCQRDRLKLPG
jgi:hypothetical protein